MEDIAHAAKVQREANDAVLECLTGDIDQRAERSKLILAALSAAAVPLDLLTASILHSLGCEMSSLIQSFYEDGE